VITPRDRLRLSLQKLLNFSAKSTPVALIYVFCLITSFYLLSLSFIYCIIESKVKHKKGKRKAKNQGKKTTKRKGFIAEPELGIALGPPCLALELKKKKI
jgi:hypothetical protein